MSQRIDGVAEPLVWNLRRLVDEYGAGGVRSVLDRLTEEWPDNMPLDAQIDRLGRFILGLDCGYPNRSAGACEMAVQMIGDYRAAMTAALSELGVPNDAYPAPVSNAVKVLTDALDPLGSRHD